ncbi:MAG: NAD(P)-binding protein [Chryseobacterium sp.]|uniref:NAD(P)-binding protein n=1 Tax=Chryseobacterium sp. TaxID=1871047 RepID=UPI0025C2588F|nr:NAD(P)-binding protein [Chryseobacterium sp.]MCJ7933858.1 NAD(P)-binding protein [Chryseobacterium sp.]
MKKIAVVGAGISGLSMANYLEKHNIDYHIYERRKKMIQQDTVFFSHKRELSTSPTS